MTSIFRDGEGMLSPEVAFGVIADSKLELEEDNKPYGPGRTILSLVEEAQEEGGTAKLEQAPLNVSLVDTMGCNAKPGEDIAGVALWVDFKRLDNDLDPRTIQRVLARGYIGSVSLLVVRTELYRYELEAKQLARRYPYRLYGNSGGDLENFREATVFSMVSLFDHLSEWTEDEDGLWAPPITWVEPADEPAVGIRLN